MPVTKARSLVSVELDVNNGLQHMNPTQMVSRREQKV